MYNPEIFNGAHVVPGHSAFRDGVKAGSVNVRDPNSWALLPYQLEGGPNGEGEHVLYLEQLASGLVAAAKDPSKILILSGGHTRQESGNGNQGWSEGASYLVAAEQLVDEMDLVSSGVLDRTIVGERTSSNPVGTRDSFQNVKDSISLFEEITGIPAEEVVFHGFPFKEPRFQLHFKEIARSSGLVRFPRLVYVKVIDPNIRVMPQTLKGEGKTFEQFKIFPRGDGGDLLDKREKRGTFSSRQSPPGYSQQESIARFHAYFGYPPRPQPRRTRVLSGTQ